MAKALRLSEKLDSIFKTRADIDGADRATPGEELLRLIVPDRTANASASLYHLAGCALPQENSVETDSTVYSPNGRACCGIHSAPAMFPGSQAQ